MKRTRSLKKIILISLAVVLFLAGSRVFAQNLREEVEQRPIEAFQREVAAEKKFQRVVKGKLYKHLKLTYGYDTNPLLGTTRRGDDYESFRLGMDYRRTFAERHQYAFSLNATQQNYNEITELSNSLGNLGVDYKLALTKEYILGAGYDLSLAYYDKNADSRFMANKGNVSFQHRISPNFFHKIQYEFSLKHYDEALALLDSASTYKDNKRRDLNDAVVYSVGYTMSERFSTNTSLRYARNDSNSDFQDYYDYDSYDLTPRIYYKINDALTATLSYSYKFKEYKNRLAGSTDDEQVDQISRLDLGLNYDLNDSHSFSLNYGYNANDSNNPASEYTGNSIEAGWRYNF